MAATAITFSGRGRARSAHARTTNRFIRPLSVAVAEGGSQMRLAEAENAARPGSCVAFSASHRYRVDT
jgi:hypothetical protein